MNEHIITGLVILITLGASAQWLAWRLRIPSILVLLVVGFVAGPLTGLLDPESLLGPVTFPIVSLGAAVILFEGGLTASWQDIRSVAAPVRRLVTVGLLITWVGGTIAAYYFLHLTLELSALLGAILVVTGPTVIGPLMRHARPRGQVGQILKFEGILNDPIGAMLAVLVFQVIETERVEAAVYLVVWGVAKAVVLATTLGFAAGWCYTKVRERNWLPESLENPVLLALAVGVYALANSAQHDSGLLAVTVLGITLASQQKVNIEANVEFTEHARTVLISVLFVLLTARMKLSDVTDLPLGAIGFVAMIIVLIRPLAVMASTVRTELSWRERLFLGAMAPKGIVAAAMASIFALRLVSAGYEPAAMLMPITFVVIAVCVAVYGLGAIPLVWALDLKQTTPQGVLLLGANRIARTIADALRTQGLRVLLVDPDRSQVRRARLQGLEAEHGRLLSEHVLNRIDLYDIGHFVAITPSDDTNALAAAHIRDVFGLETVHQLHASDSSGERQREYATELRGTHFAGDKTYDELLTLIHRGATGTVTRLSDTLSFEDYCRNQGEQAIPLFVLSESGSLRILDRNSPSAVSGERLICLSIPSDDIESSLPDDPR